MRSTALLVFVLSILHDATADGNDWVDPAFVLQKTGGSPGAQKKITNYAASSAKEGPWTITTNNVLPPDGDKNDYLSWAPYHWPNCNWCTGPRTHLTTGGNRTNTTDGSDSGSMGDGGRYAGDDTADDGNDSGGETGNDNGLTDSSSEDEGNDDGSGDLPSPDIPNSPISSLPVAHRKMIRRVRRFAHHERSVVAVPHIQLDAQVLSNERAALDLLSTALALLPTNIPNPKSTTSADNVASGTPAGAANARKTQSPKPTTSTHKATKTTNSPSSCTTSPSMSLPPSATWTTCPYVVHDGQLNPDVRTLQGVDLINSITQSSLYNALASILTGTQSQAKNAASFIQIFFLDPQKGMHPEVNYGQVIRGPQKQVGQYLGILDFRGMVKIANAIAIMRAAHEVAWTDQLDTQMNAWSKEYVNWLQTSTLGKTASSAPNNHGTFFANQAGAMNILLSDSTSAAAVLNAYFTNQFLDQIAKSGEQPFEAVRTRPYHYRCFNLEGMITNAKLGDQLGIDFWTTTSKYGVTIQTALDYTMALNPGKEDVTDIFPHVAAVAAAYGDPSGKYNAFLKQKDSAYGTAPYYYYDQTGALTQAPAAKGGKGMGKSAKGMQTRGTQDAAGPKTTANSPATAADGPASTADGPYLPDISPPTIPFECPAAFATATQVQLDDGIYVTCDELKPFYGYVEDAVKNM